MEQRAKSLQKISAAGMFGARIQNPLPHMRADAWGGAPLSRPAVVHALAP